MFIQSGELDTILIINKLKRYLGSIRFWIMLLVILCGMLPLGLGGALICQTYYQTELNDRMVALQNSCVTLADQMAAHDYLTGGRTSLTVEAETLADVYDGRIQIVDSSYQIITDTYRIYEGKYCISKEVFQCFAGKSYSNISEEDGYIELVLPIVSSSTQEVIGVLIASSSIANLQNRLSDMQRRMGTLQLVLGILLCAAGYVIAKVIERPFTKLIRTLTEINAGNMELTIANEGYTELRDINSGYSGAMKQLREIDRSRQEFVSNVSHELKTPITSIKVLTDTLLASEGAEEALYREFLTDIANEVNRENDIINDLLAMVRLDKGTDDMNIAQVNINTFVEDILRRLKPIAAGRNIEMTFETFRPVIAEIDEVKLSLAIMNIVENAIKYNVDHGWVKVSLNADHKYFYVDVSDSGVGIPEDETEKIFERFYRVDKARSRDTGGTGLGLAITKRIIVMHKGTITVSSPAGGGTQFVVRIPLNYTK